MGDFAGREDSRLLTGKGQFVDDLRFDNEVHARFIRSTLPHGEIRNIDANEAVSKSGVLGFWSAKDLEGHVLPIGQSKADGGVFEDPLFRVLGKDAGFIRHVERTILAKNKVRHVGQAIGVLVAENAYIAEDAAMLLNIDIDELPSVVDPILAGQQGSPKLYDWPDNICLDLRVGTGDVQKAFANAAFTTRRVIHSGRLSCVPIETRGVVAIPELGRRAVTIYSSTQIPHMVKDLVMEVLKLDATAVRVIAPDVGGGFGAKAIPYEEEVMIAWLALELGRPVRWFEDRYEHFVSSINSRDQLHDIEIALDKEGVILGIKDTFVSDVGCFSPLGVVQPYNTAAHLTGCYRVPAFDIHMLSVVTNKPPLSPYRGAGRPEAVFAMERILDIAAREAGFDPFVIRQKNIIKREEIPYKVGIPYRDGVPIVYDTGDFAACLDKAIEISEEFSLRSDAPNTQLIGRGVACYVEGTGVGPFESAEIVVKEDGTVIVATGACSQGQSHETVFAQLVATKLGIDPSFVFVKGGDTDETQYGWGTLASRSAVVAGSAINNACEKLLTRVRAAVSSLWEVAESDLEFIDGVSVKGSPGRTLSWPQISHEFSPRGLFAHQFGVGLHESDHYSPATVTFANGAHVATVSVDVETGLVAILDYVVVHDCGPLLDEGVVTGQIQGGVAQGIGAALYEELIFDDSGQPLNPNLVEYIIPTLAEIPEIRISHYETISPGNPLGIKGVGEAGTIPVPAAIANAICDALASKGIEILRVPATPKYILGLLAKK